MRRIVTIAADMSAAPPASIARSGDFWSGVALAALGAYIISQARGWVYSGPDGPGAGFFPLWYGIGMVALSLVLVVRNAISRQPTGVIAWPEVRRAIICWAAFMVSAALFKFAGFMLSFALLTWFIVAVMFRRSQALAFTVAITGALLFQLVFDVGLGVSLPYGFGH